jgi:hypothetical protein
VRFLFDCGTFDGPALAGIVLQKEEIAAYRFVCVERALDLLSGPVRRRVAATVSNPGRLRYLEDGRPVR